MLRKHIETVQWPQREREFDRGIPDAALKSMMPDFWGLLKEGSEFGKSPAKQPGHRVVYFCKFCVFRLHFVRKVICYGTAEVRAKHQHCFAKCIPPAGSNAEKNAPQAIFYSVERTENIGEPGKVSYGKRLNTEKKCIQKNH